MLKKICGKLRERRGNMMVQSAAVLMITTMFSVVCYSGIGVLLQKQRLDTLADEIRRNIEIDGRYSDCERTQAENLLSSNNLRASVTCTASGNINLGDSFTVYLSTAASFGFGGYTSISVPLAARSDGKSEVYWK